ncbi:MAG TPA: Rid family detoxifying hydrolase [Gemmatimonadales bacterium]|nr:Rid family detoxifying hydrolase [Gemmatimonadales bacterium]
MRVMRMVGAALLVGSAAPAQDRQVIQPGGMLSAAVRVGPMLYLSGQLGTDPSTRQLAAGGIGPETRQTMENIKRLLEENGSGLHRVVKCTVFLADMADYGAMNEVYRSFFPGDPPARSTVAVAGLVRNARVEIECMALAGT